MLLFKYLWFYCCLPAKQPICQPPLVPEVSTISKAICLSGRRPARLRLQANPAVLATKNGVRVRGCAYWKNVDTNEQTVCYNYRGLTPTVMPLLAIEKGTYAGHSYLLLQPATCQRYVLSGEPFFYGDKLVCFNEEQTTDRIDFVQVWRVQPDGSLHLHKTVPLGLNHNHADDYHTIRFSPDGKYLYYQNVGLPESYSACRL